MAVAIPLTVRANRLREAAVKAARDVQARGRRLSRVTRARAGYGSGLLSAAWGVGVVFGFGWALIVAGVAVSGSFLLLYDVDPQ